MNYYLNYVEKYVWVSMYGMNMTEATGGRHTGKKRELHRLE